MSFSDNGYPVARLTPADSEQGRASLFRAVEKVSSKGAYTNLYAALRRAHDMFDSQTDHQRPRYIILMSDGEMDVGNAPKTVC